MNLDSKTMQLPPRPGIAELSVKNKVCMCVVLCVCERGAGEIQTQTDATQREMFNLAANSNLQFQTFSFRPPPPSLCHHPIQPGGISNLPRRKTLG